MKHTLADNLIDDVKTSFEKSTTPQKYQAFMNMLHFFCGVNDLRINRYIDDLNYIGKVGIDYFSENQEFINQAKTLINDYIPLLVKHGAKAMLAKDFYRVIEKFKIKPEGRNAKRIYDNLRIIYKERTENVELVNAINDLKTLLIEQRLLQKFPNISENEVIKIVHDYVYNNICLRKVKLYLNEKNIVVDEGKLERIFGKFTIFKSLNSPKSVIHKAIDNIRGELHEKFAYEVELLNKIERITFKGDEVFYRGVTGSSTERGGGLTKEMIISNLNHIHRGVTKLNNDDVQSLFSHQIKTPDNLLIDPISKNEKATLATAVTVDAGVAIRYSLGVVGSVDQGWVFEILPKKGGLGINLSDYNVNRNKYKEITLSQINAEDIKAIYHVKRVNPEELIEELIIDEVILNPFYKKRPQDTPELTFLYEGMKITLRNNEVIFETTPKKVAHEKRNIMFSEIYLREHNPVKGACVASKEDIAKKRNILKNQNLYKNIKELKKSENWQQAVSDKSVINANSVGL